MLTGQLGSAVEIARCRQLVFRVGLATPASEHVVGRHVDQSRTDAAAGARQRPGTDGVHGERLLRLRFAQIHGLEHGAVDPHAVPPPLHGRSAGFGTPYTWSQTQTES